MWPARTLGLHTPLFAAQCPDFAYANPAFSGNPELRSLLIRDCLQVFQVGGPCTKDPPSSSSPPSA